MGREIRRVPPNWEHPQNTVWDPWRNVEVVQYQPMYDRDVQSRMDEWLAGYQKWLTGEFNKVRQENPDLTYSEAEPYRAFCDWEGEPPDPKYYRPKWTDGEATWFQVYETVSEGTPVSPPFETAEELAQYLADYGDFWYQKDQREGHRSFRTKPTIDQARAFVCSGFALTGIAIAGNGEVLDAYAQLDLK